MDYLALPPEINSARIETGPGSAPLLEAAAAWTALANGLAEASTQRAIVVADLAAAWNGPSESAFSQANASYAAWMTATAASAARSAQAAMQAASAYETVRAGMVPLVAVVANRAQLSALVATNIFGQNTPAIMATEATYAEMWAQDVAAMVAYRSESAGATVQLTQPTQAPQVTTGIDAQGITQAVTTQTVLPAGTQSILSWLTSPNDFLTALGNPATPVGFLETQWLALQSSGVYQVLSYPLIMGLMGQANGMMGRANDLTEQGNQISGEMEEDDRAQARMTPPAFEAPPPAHIEGSRGGASKAGWLSVPPNWDKQTQQVQLASQTTPLTTPGTTPGMMPMPIAAVNSPDKKQRNASEVLLRVKFVPTEGV